MPESIQIRNNDFSIRTWYLNETEEELKNGISLNSSDELKLTSLSNLKRRKIFWITRRLALAENISQIDYTNSGKPFSQDRKISISHSGNWIGMMTSVSFETGIDIEFPYERIHKIKDRFLTSEEKNTVCNDNTFLLTIAWGVKEAVFKKYGGPTVFFRENINLLEIDPDQNCALVKCITQQGIIDQALKFEILSDGYILVYTL